MGNRRFLREWIPPYVPWCTRCGCSLGEGGSPSKGGGILLYEVGYVADMAKVVIASVCGSEGRWFESIYSPMGESCGGGGRMGSGVARYWKSHRKVLDGTNRGMDAMGRESG